jgi:hypothetical protein
MGTQSRNCRLYVFAEPTSPSHGAFPKGYGVADFERDFRIFNAWAAKAAPAMKLIGPGGTAAGTMMKRTPQSARISLRPIPCKLLIGRPNLREDCLYRAWI